MADAIRKQLRTSPIHCVCGGLIAIKDWRKRGEFRYEAYCPACLSCDPNGYSTIENTVAGAKLYFSDVRALVR
jgi:hypothetical protein